MTDITRKRGDTYADVIIVKSKKTKQAINITGYSFVLTVDTKQAPTDATTKVYQLAGAILDAAAGRVEFAPNATQANHVGDFFYDIQMTDGTGRKRTIESGKYKYLQDITKD